MTVTLHHNLIEIHIKGPRCIANGHKEHEMSLLFFNHISLHYIYIYIYIYYGESEHKLFI